MIKFITFYTTKYKPEADKCIQSFEKLGIKVDGLFYGTEKDWMRNCLKRAELLQRYWEAYPNNPICLLDSDLVALKHPKLLYCCKEDIALEYRPNVPDYRTYSAGIILFNNTPLGKQCLDVWCSMCIEDAHPGKKLREQYYLKLMVEGIPNLKILKLPNSYNAKPEQVNVDTVILHNVASRRMGIGRCL